MGNLEHILNKRMKDLGLKKQVDASMIVVEAQERINKVFGSRGSDNLKVVSFKKGALKIAAKNSAWASECRLNSKKLLINPIEKIIYTYFSSEEEY